MLYNSTKFPTTLRNCSFVLEVSFKEAKDALNFCRSCSTARDMAVFGVNKAGVAFPHNVWVVVRMSEMTRISQMRLQEMAGWVDIDSFYFAVADWTYVSSSLIERNADKL